MSRPRRWSSARRIRVGRRVQDLHTQGESCFDSQGTQAGRRIDQSLVSPLSRPELRVRLRISSSRPHLSNLRKSSQLDLRRALRVLRRVHVLKRKFLRKNEPTSLQRAVCSHLSTCPPTFSTSGRLRTTRVPTLTRKPLRSSRILSRIEIENLVSKLSHLFYAFLHTLLR